VLQAARKMWRVNFVSVDRNDFDINDLEKFKGE
jgi:hypothetical protein